MGWTNVEGAAIEDGVIHLRKRRHVVRFSGIAERPALSLNRGFSAPVTLSAEQRPEDRYFLARHDSDTFSRWQAFNTILTEALIAASREIRGGRQPEFASEIMTLAGDFAGDDSLDAAYRALALTLPAEADVAREIGNNIDPDAIFAAREALARAIAVANAALFARLYEALADGNAFSPDAESAGRRALRNALLDYLSVEPGATERASRQFAAATNMTDRAAALTVLAHRHAGSKPAARALVDFERRYRADHLVLDKWFQIQATTPGHGTLELVADLTRHPAFSITNPNRVRALIGTFSSANQTGFHRPDGAGYAFFADFVLKVERTNPQIAARLATAMRSWRSLEPGRQQKAREALISIAKAKDLSADLRDIVERTLS